jgi:hypothetical protein
MARLVFPFVRSFLLTAPIFLPPQNLSPGTEFRGLHKEKSRMSKGLRFDPDLRCESLRDMTDCKISARQLPADKKTKCRG